jgi:hypothetical protein
MSCDRKIDRRPVAVNWTLPRRSVSAPSIKSTPSCTEIAACFPVPTSSMKMVPGPSSKLFQRNVDVPSVKMLSADGMRSPVTPSSGVQTSISASPLVEPSTSSVWTSDSLRVCPGGQYPSTRSCSARALSSSRRASIKKRPPSSTTKRRAAMLTVLNVRCVVCMRAVNAARALTDHDGCPKRVKHLYSSRC